MKDESNISVGFRLKESEYELLKETARTEQRSIGSVMSTITRAFLKEYSPGRFREMLNAAKEN